MDKKSLQTLSYIVFGLMVAGFIISFSTMIHFKLFSLSFLITLLLVLVGYLVLLLIMLWIRYFTSASSKFLRISEIITLIIILVVTLAFIPKYMYYSFTLAVWIFFSAIILSGYYAIYVWVSTHDNNLFGEERGKSLHAYLLTHCPSDFWPYQGNQMSEKVGVPPVSEDIKAFRRRVEQENLPDLDNFSLGAVPYGVYAQKNGAITNINGKKVYFEATNGWITIPEVPATKKKPAVPSESQNVRYIFFFDKSLLITSFLTGIPTGVIDTSNPTQPQIERLQIDPLNSWMIPYEDLRTIDARPGRGIILSTAGKLLVTIEERALWELDNGQPVQIQPVVNFTQFIESMSGVDRI